MTRQRRAVLASSRFIYSKLPDRAFADLADHTGLLESLVGRDSRAGARPSLLGPALGDQPAGSVSREVISNTHSSPSRNTNGKAACWVLTFSFAISLATPNGPSPLEDHMIIKRLPSLPEKMWKLCPRVSRESEGFPIHQQADLGRVKASAARFGPIPLRQCDQRQPPGRGQTRPATGNAGRARPVRSLGNRRTERNGAERQASRSLRRRAYGAHSSNRSMKRRSRKRASSHGASTSLLAISVCQKIGMAAAGRLPRST